MLNDGLSLDKAKAKKPDGRVIVSSIATVGKGVGKRFITRPPAHHLQFGSQVDAGCNHCLSKAVSRRVSPRSLSFSMIGISIQKLDFEPVQPIGVVRRELLRDIPLVPAAYIVQKWQV